MDGVRAIVGDDVPFEAGHRNAELEALFGRHDFVGCCTSPRTKPWAKAWQPAMYASNNVGGLGVLLEVASAHEVDNIVFSSSCTCTASPRTCPWLNRPVPTRRIALRLDQTGVRTRLEDHAAPGRRMCLAPVLQPHWRAPLRPHRGAAPGCAQQLDSVPHPSRVRHPQGPDGVWRRLRHPDGTCIRDYLHVMDLAEAHVAALQWCLDQPDDRSAIRPFNLGTGQGASVLEVIQSFERATGQKVPYNMGDRREGDVVAIWAAPSRAADDLGWRTTRSLETSLADAWRWQEKLNQEGSN